MYNLKQEDLNKLKDIGFDNLIHDFGEVIGSHMGGSEENYSRARMFMQDFINELSHELDPDNHEYLHDEDE